MVEGRSDSKSGGRIRLGMVGGGHGAFIGAVHRIAARMDDNYELVAGALSSQRQRAIDSALELGIARDRAYGDFEEMAKAEAKRKDGIEAVSIVTPNFMHAGPIKAFLKAGIHVICDKPLAMSVTEAKDIQRAVKRSGKIFALTHNYTGYPMIRQARAIVAAGELGEIRQVQAEYAQDWLTERLEATGQKQADWRTDPKRAGAGALGDIATHAYNLACFVTGLSLDSLSADLTTFVKGRKLDDNDNILLRWKSGAKGMLWASQVAPGNENNLSLRVYGSKGGLAMEAGGPELSVVHRLRPADQADHPRRRGRQCRCGTRVAHALGPSGRLSGRLRQHLCRDCPRHPCRAHRPGSAPRGALPDGRGRAGGHAVHRGGTEVERQGRRLGQGVGRLAPIRKM